MTHPSDTDLVQSVLAGERRAFDALIGRHEQGLRAFFGTRVREDWVEDLMQETLLRALIGIADLKEPERFRSWLVGIGANLVRTVYRKQQNQSTSLDEYETSNPFEIQVSGRTFSPEEDLLFSERESAVKRAIAALPDRTREVVELHYVEGLSYKEISDRLGVRIPAIEGRLYRARQRLKEDLKMTQSTTDMFELQDRLNELQEQIADLQEKQKRLVKEDAASLQLERTAAAGQICRLPVDEDDPITWGVLGAFRTESQNHKRYSIYSTNLDEYLASVTNEQIAGFMTEFANPLTVEILKDLVRGPADTADLARKLKLSDENLAAQLARLESVKFVAQNKEKGKVQVEHHDVVVALLTIINITQNHYVHVIKEIDPDDRQASNAGSESNVRTRSRTTTKGD